MRENNEKKMNNKGFSLVELIIVIAIMGILVGVVGTQVIPYMERSKEAKDQQLLSSVATAVTSAIALTGAEGTDITEDTLTLLGGDTTEGINTPLEKQVAELITGDATKNPQTYIGDKFTSNKAKPDGTAKIIKVNYDADTGKMFVWIGSAGFNATSGAFEPGTDCIYVESN